jgi:cyclic beta-1,2-glucan synthetase
VVLETILGLTKRGDTLTPCPRVPSGWSGYSIEYRHGGTPHRIVVELTAADSDAAEVILDGPRIAGSVLALVDDGRVHDVVVRLARRPTGGPMTAG